MLRAYIEEKKKNLLPSSVPYIEEREILFSVLQSIHRKKRSKPTSEAAWLEPCKVLC